MSKNIHTIITKNHTRVINKLSKNALNDKDSEGKTLLHWAVIEKKFALVKLLVGRGCKLDVCDKDYFTPLQYSDENSEIETFLLENGSPLRGCQEIHLAAKAGDILRMSKILSEDPDLIHYVDSNLWTPIFYAAANSKEKAVQFLLDNGAALDWVDADQRNLVDVASVEGNNAQLSKDLEECISLSDEESAPLVKSFKEILEKEYEVAKKLNKKLLVMFGELHGIYSIRELVKRFLQVAKDMGISHFNIELPHLMAEFPTESYAKKLNMTVNRVDTHLFREKANVKLRNGVIANKVDMYYEDNILLVGADHVPGLLEDKDGILSSNAFHVLPFNLCRIADGGFNTFRRELLEGDENLKFVEDSNKVIQVERSGISDPYSVVKQWNNETPFKPGFLDSRIPKIIDLLLQSTVMLLSAYVYSYFQKSSFLNASLMFFGVGAIKKTATVFVEREKTYGLHEYQNMTDEELSKVNLDKLGAFIDGTQSTSVTSLVSYRDWQYMRDYYAGSLAAQTKEHKLISAVKARVALK